MMSKKQNVVWNFLSVISALISYVVLKTYSDFHYIQAIQKIFLALIFFSGLVIIMNNFLYLKHANKKYIAISLICAGVILSAYSGFILYLILALQNTGF